VWFTLAWYVAMPPQAWRSDSLVASFVSVGHGTSVLLELPDGRNLLYDCGRLGSPRSGARPIASVLWSRGITHLDAVILSHADLDHYNALPELLERFSVGQVVVSTVMWAKPAPGLHVLRQAIENAGVPITSVRAGDEFALGAPHVQLSILHPPRGGILGSDNANSLVLLVEHAGRRLLLTGDLEERGMSDLLSEEPVACDVVLAPHHGSTRSNPVGFALWCQPRYVVISGRHEAMPGRGAEQVERAFQARRAEVLHTSLHGLIECRLSAAGTQVRTFRQPPESP
jgi:competence protein ComEC